MLLCNSLSLTYPTIIEPLLHAPAFCSWEGVRVQCLAYRADGRHILAADTLHRVRLMWKSPLTWWSPSCVQVLQLWRIVGHPLDPRGSRHHVFHHRQLWSVCLAQHRHSGSSHVGYQSQVIKKTAILEYLSSIDLSRALVRKFVGITQGFYTIHSCFGGLDQSFVASGSEDMKVNWPLTMTMKYESWTRKPFMKLTDLDPRSTSSTWGGMRPSPFWAGTAEQSTVCLGTQSIIRCTPFFFVLFFLLNFCEHHNHRCLPLRLMTTLSVSGVPPPSIGCH